MIKISELVQFCRKFLSSASGKMLTSLLKCAQSCSSRAKSLPLGTVTSVPARCRHECVDSCQCRVRTLC